MKTRKKNISTGNSLKFEKHWELQEIPLIAEKTNKKPLNLAKIAPENTLIIASYK